MTLGLSLASFTLLHVAISLVGIASGLLVMAAMIGRRPIAPWNAVFLVTTILTSVTGFMFPATALLPSHIVGIISLAVLAVALFALRGRHLAGAWRGIYVAMAALALYLNCFVAVVQSFLKIGALTALAPTQTEPPFLIGQALVLVAMLLLGVMATLRYRPARPGIG